MIRRITILLLITISFPTAASAQTDTATFNDYYSRIYSYADTAVAAPTFHGGERAMYSYFAQNIRYPLKAKKHHTVGKVVAMAIIEKDGRVTNIKLIDDIGDGCGAAVIRTLRAMPRWNSATLNSIPVRYLVRIPITFQM